MYKGIFIVMNNFQGNKTLWLYFCVYWGCTEFVKQSVHVKEKDAKKN
jgi:hypothetical protein